MIPIRLKRGTTSSPLQEIHIVTSTDWNTRWKDFYPSEPSFFSAKAKECDFISSKKGQTILCGIGEEKNPGKIQAIVRDFSFHLKDKIREGDTQIILPDSFSLEEKLALVIGLYEGGYEYPFVGLHPFYEDEFMAYLDLKEEEFEVIFSQVSALITGKFFCMDWLNKPANLKTAPILSDVIRSLSDQYDWTVKILDGMGCMQEGLGAYLSVNSASQYDAAFAIIDYHPSGAVATVGLVGKTVTFDTGGVSIKPSSNMHYMKSDMGGGTAVLGALIASSILALPIRIVAILPITDNVVNNTATLPGDVVTACNGLTIEVQNTDAEGRLTLADGLAYMTKNYPVDYLLDLATLTGSVIRTFGNECAGIMCNDSALQRDLIKVGTSINEKLWPLPLWDEYDEMMKSDVADINNIASKPYAGCITAAKFLEHFIEGHQKWAHLDIAGTAFGSRPYAKDKCATSYGVELLTRWMSQLVRR